ncbi:MAG: hypothetical protein LOX98_08175 [Lysobacter sp.]|nr:hypothetical protein [Lysobacter sp.]MDV5981383.1 hypothetical protein [Lysobacter sp.]
MTLRASTTTLAAALVLSALAAPAAADDRAVIEGQAAAGTSGRIAVNQAAGTGNAQANLAAIAIADGGTGLVGLQARQQPTAGALDRAASAQLRDGAFSASQGLLSVNQVAGSGNAQANLFAIGQLGSPAVALVAGVDDAALAGVAGDTTSGGAQPTSRPREAFIADDAFRGSQGVVQVNQTAGVGNASTNAIVLQLPGGTP